MRHPPVVLGLLGALLFAGGCGESPCESESVYAVTYVWTYQGPYPAVRPQDGTHASGIISADPLPAFESVSMNGEELSGPCEYLDWCILSFGPCHFDSEPDPIAISVRTSLGNVSGAVHVPEVLTAIELSEEDTLGIGESLTMSWPGHEADFYWITLRYDWGSGSTDIDTLASGASVTFDGSLFYRDGEIRNVMVQPHNGPVPRPGAVGNMCGVGSGYLYCAGDGFFYDGTIQVGAGVPRSDRRPIGRVSHEEPATAERIVARALGLPVRRTE
jgi:hypothetical protein